MELFPNYKIPETLLKYSHFQNSPNKKLIYITLHQPKKKVGQKKTKKNYAVFILPEL